MATFLWPPSFPPVHFPFLLLFIFLHSVFSCSPPPPNPFPGGNQPISPSARHSPSRLFGEQTQQGGGGGGGGGGTEFSPGIDQASALSGPVKSPEELYCYDFDDKCRWRNMEGLLVDELDWYQGAGFLDENRLRLTTGTHLAPEGFYGIAATDRVEFAGSKAILVSDVIECQMGVANLRFHYWTSPEVKIIVCVKSVLRLFPYFDYCSKPIENGDPGPVFVTLPEINEPMQIFIQAHNFVFTSSAIQGGFAIIDNLEYFGEFCEREVDPKSQFAAARNAPPQSALRPDYQQLAPLAQLNGGMEQKKGELAVENSTPQATGGGPFEGFRSMLDWMIFGNGLAMHSKLQEMLNNSTTKPEMGAPPSTASTPSGRNGPVDNLVHIVETVPTPPLPPPPPPSLPSPSKFSESPRPQFPELLPFGGHELRSIRVVKRPPPMPKNEEEVDGNEGAQMMQIGPMDIRKSLLVNGQMPANLQIRRRQPHLELLARRREEGQGGHRRERVEEAEEGEMEGEREGEEGMEEENEPNQVEREEWIG